MSVHKSLGILDSKNYVNCKNERETLAIGGPEKSMNGKIVNYKVVNCRDLLYILSIWFNIKIKSVFALSKIFKSFFLKN